ncbi:MAG TPA: hypothetical protein VIY86_14365 [Pirellulaceae bacterium]
MIRPLARWLISRALDGSYPLPRWIRNRIDRDPELRDYQRNAIQLAQRLRADGPAWLAAQAEFRELSPRRERSQVEPSLQIFRAPGMIRGWTLGIAAVSLVLVLWAGSERLTHVAHVREGLAPRTTSLSPATTPLMPAHVVVTHSGLARKGVRLGVSWLQSMTQRAEKFPASLDLSPAAAVRVLEEPTQSTGIALGRFLADINLGLQGESRHLQSGARSSFDFFAKQLPQSTARLMGLDPL